MYSRFLLLLIGSRKRALTQSTPDFSALLAAEVKNKRGDDCTHSYLEEQRTPCILPVIPNSATDFNRIDASTVNALLAGDYQEKIEKYVIMDCRFDYEFEGGHIQGAINMSPQKLFEYFTGILYDPLAHRTY